MNNKAKQRPKRRFNKFGSERSNSFIETLLTLFIGSGLMSEIDPLVLTEELANHAYKSYSETEQLRQESLQSLRQKIQQLPNPSDQLKDVSDVNLIRFLRSKKFRLEKALKSTIDYQCFLDQHAADLKDITAEEISHFHDVFTIFQEPSAPISSDSAATSSTKDEELKGGRLIIILHLQKLIGKATPEYRKAFPKFMLRLRYFFFEQLSKSPRAQIFGTILIFSGKGLTFWESMSVSQLASVQDHLACFQHFQILGTRFKGAFALEEPPFLSWVWFFITPILSEKIKNRFHFCGRDYSKLHEVVFDVRILPKSLGGDRDDHDCGNWFVEECQRVFGSS